MSGRGRVVVVPHDPAWRTAFKSEAARLSAVLGENLVRIHHVGSTAVPGLPAKPTIDMLPVVADLGRVSEATEDMAGIGYEAWEEYGLPGRRLFTRADGETRTHNVHVWEDGDPEIERHLAFRDYMISHPEEARAYGRLKLNLARDFPADFDGYMDGKDAFVRERERRALAWHRAKREERA